MPANLPRARELFLHAVGKLKPDHWDGYVAEASGGDIELEQQVRGLLQLHREAGSFLDSPAIAVDVSHTINQPLERPGTQIGPYKLLEQIGEGGFGVVFMAAQTEPVRRKVALKVLKPGMDTRQVVARFEAERQALAIMDHPNIAKVLDGGATPSGRPYFVMDLVKGVPITEFCDQNCLTPRQRLELFVSVCQTVQHAHQKGIIHRDLKPTNIMVTVHDVEPVVKVIDFGVAKALGQELTDKSLFTGFAQMIGTPQYMSPEQAGQSGLDIDTRSDIYSLGVLLYELLTGTTPFGKERLGKAGLDEIRRIIREEEPAKPSTRISTLAQAAADTVSGNRRSDPQRLKQLVRGELDWIAMKALEKDRNRRYETASALAADVKRYLHDEPVEACPPSALYQFRKFARRYKRGLLTAAVVALVVVLTAAGSGGFIWRANQDLRQALDRERFTAYIQRIALTEREWAANNLGGVEQLLDDCPEDLRGWEWHYLKRLRYSTHAPLRHESGVLRVAYSPDSQYLATVTKDGFVRLWQAKTGQQRQKWQAHGENVPAVEFSRDGRFLATGSWDKTVKVWDVEKVLQGEVPVPLRTLETTNKVWSVAFSPDNQRLAAAGGREADEKGELNVWDMNTFQPTLTSTFAWALRCVRFSPDGRRLATAGGEFVKLKDAETGRELLTCRDPHGALQAVSFSPDGRRIAAAGGHIEVDPGRGVKVWNAQTGEEVFILRGHVGGLRSVTFSPDGRRLASAGLDQTIKLWDAATGQEVLTLRGPLDHVFCVAFSPDGSQLASASLDSTVQIWDASQEPASGPEYRTLPGHTGPVTGVAFHPDGRSLASVGTDGTVRVWDVLSGKQLYTLPGEQSRTGMRVAYSPDGRRLAVVSVTLDAPARIWDTTSQKETRIRPGNNGPDLCLEFSPDGRHVASAGNDFVVRVWDATTGNVVQELKNHSWPIHTVAFGPPDGRLLASGSADRSVRIWDWAAGKELCALEPRHASRVQSVAFSRDGKLLASASWDRTIKVWDSATWKLLDDLPDPTGAVLSVAFGPDRRLAWGSTDSTVKVWDGPGTQTHVLRGHTSWVQSVAFSPDGKWIASGSLDGTVKIWPAPAKPQDPAAEAEEQGNEVAARSEED